MNTLVIYDSVYGNTEKIADAIATIWRQYGHSRTVSALNAGDQDLEGVNLVAIGGPTQKHGLSPAMNELLNRFVLEEFATKYVVAFDTRLDVSQWLSGSAAEHIVKKLNRLGIRTLLPPESYFVERNEGPLKPGEIERAENWARMALEKLGVTPLFALSR